MADIALRSYYEEVDGLIDGNRVEEAIAHLKHILGIYPKALDAYRLLAKALLEKNRHLDAADVFQRVLSSVPDDFIAHIGMAVVREDEGNLDAAIWHMERAYEVQPSSTPIQEELRRLYGKRDGAEPPRLRLSRAALARMYEKGDLYQQAVGELRVALRDDPDRLDLRVMLASALWRCSQRAEAAETSAKLLEILPFCREANRILADVWTESGRPQEAENYRRRLEALDPYEAFANPAHNGSGAAVVTPEQIVVPHLDNVYGETGADSSRPDWMEALGIQYDQSAASETVAPGGEWLDALAGTGAAAGETAAPAAQTLPGTDWLSSIRGEDLQPQTGTLTSSTGPAPAAASVPAESGSAPDWLAGLAVSDSPAVSEPQSRGVPGATDWLSDMNAGDQARSAPDSAPAGAPEPGDVPAWMIEPDSDTHPGAQPAAAPSTGTQRTGTGMTGWLTALAGDLTAQAATPSAESEMPEWLQPDAAAGVPVSDRSEAAPPAENPNWSQATELPQSATAPVDELPGWLSTEAGAAQPSAGTSDKENPPAEGGLPDWLAIGGSIPATSDRADRPDWSLEAVTETQPARNLAGWPASGGDEAASTDSAKSELPDWLKAPLSDSSTEPVREPGSELPDWLASNAAAEAESSAAAQDIPDWLKAPPAEAPLDVSASAPSEAAGWPAAGAATTASAPEDVPSWLNSTEADESGGPSWLAASAADESVEEEFPPTDRAAEMARADEEIPDWMKSAGWVPRDPSIPLDSPDNVIGPEVDAREAEAEPAEVPDWLKALKPAEEPKAATRPAADAPGWLRQVMEGAVGDQPAPVDSSAAASAEAAGSITAADLPDWLKSVSGDPTETVAGFLKDKPKSVAPAAPDATPDWLQSNQLPPTAPAESGIREDLPDWLQAPGRNTAEVVATFLKEQSTVQPAGTPAAEAPQATIPVEPSPADMSADEALAWLESLASQQGANEEELVTKRRPEGSVAGEAELPATTDDIAQSEMSDDEALAWLEGLAARQGANPEEMVSRAEDRIAASGDSFVDALSPIADSEAGLPTPASERAAEPGFETLEPAPEAFSALPETPATAAEAISDDVTMAWLESLAARQGAAPHELVTQPEARDTDMPGWVQLEAGAALSQAPVDELNAEGAGTSMVADAPHGIDRPATSAGAESGAPSEPAASDSGPATEMNEDQALAWLESLAARQGAAADELVTLPEDRADEMPNWVKAESEAAETAKSVAGTTSIEPAVPDESDKPDWLKQMEAEADEYEAVASGAPPGAAGLEHVENAPADELPTWLAAAPTEPEPERRQKIVPAWTPSIQPETPTPPDAPELPAWLAAPVLEPEPPTWVPITQAAREPDPVAVPVIKRPKKSRSPRKPRGPRPTKLRRSEEPEIVLALARQRLAEMNLLAALEIYSELVSAGHFKADIISDLEASNLQNPGHPELLRTLGDAYMRDDQLQKALDAYKLALRQL